MKRQEFFATMKANSAEFDSETLANLTALALRVRAGALYGFEWLLWFTAGATTTGLKLGLTGPAASLLVVQSEVQISDTEMQQLTAADYGALAAGGDSIDGVNFARIVGTAQFSAGGLLIPQVATEVADSAIIIAAGSRGRAMELVP